MHLRRSDKENVFPLPISKDGRSYNDELFLATAQVLRKIGEDERLVREFVELGAKMFMQKYLPLRLVGS